MKSMIFGNRVIQNEIIYEYKEKKPYFMALEKTCSGSFKKDSNYYSFYNKVEAIGFYIMYFQMFVASMDYTMSQYKAIVISTVLKHKTNDN